MLKKVLFCGLLMLLLNKTKADNAASVKDSLVNLVQNSEKPNQKIDAINALTPYLIDNPELLIKNAQAVLSISKNINYTNGYYHSLLNLGVGYCEKHAYDTAISYLNEALDYFVRTKQAKPLIIGNNYLGISHESKTNYSKALWYYFQSLNLATQTQDSVYIIKTLNNIGVVYLVKNNYQLAEQYLVKANNLSLKHNSQLDLTNYNLAILYLEKKEYEKALQKFEMVLQSDIKSKNLKNVAETYNNIGVCYLGLNQTNTAELYLYKAFAIREKIQDENGLRNSFTDLAQLHISLNQYNKAYSFLEKALVLAQKDKNLVAQVSIYTTYINGYKAQNNLEKALYYTEQKDNILQEINNAESSVKLKELELKWTEINNETKNEVASQKQKNELISKLLFIVGGVLILALIGFLSYLIYSTKKNNNILKANQIQLAAKNDALVRQNEQILKNQQLAQQAVRAKTNFIRNISHEVRTPLNAINAIAELIKQDNLNPEQLENVGMLKESTRKLIQLMNNILDFNNLDSGNGEFTETEFKIQQMVNGLSTIYSQKIKNKGLDFMVEYPENNNNSYKSDALRIAQVLSNLIANSITFTHSGYIKLRISELSSSFFKSTFRFEVEDTGVGIPAEKQQDIFDAFSQIDDSNTRKTDGAGLGLSICQKIVAGMGGQLVFKPAQTNGSIFYFDLDIDIVDTKTNEQIPSTPQITDLTGIKILIAEDSVINVAVLKQFVKKWGSSCQVATNGVEAFNLIQSKEFDLILMDLQMPEMDGITCTREIRKLNDDYYQNIPIIALTAANESTMRQAAYEAGMNDYVLKPFESKELQERILLVLNGTHFKKT